jgi:hypothetical protein
MVGSGMHTSAPGARFARLGGRRLERALTAVTCTSAGFCCRAAGCCPGGTWAAMPAIGTWSCVASCETFLPLRGGRRRFVASPSGEAIAVTMLVRVFRQRLCVGDGGGGGTGGTPGGTRTFGTHPDGGRCGWCAAREVHAVYARCTVYSVQFPAVRSYRAT